MQTVILLQRVKDFFRAVPVTLMKIRVLKITFKKVIQLLEDYRFNKHRLPWQQTCCNAKIRNCVIDALILFFLYCFWIAFKSKLEKLKVRRFALRSFNSLPSEEMDLKFSLLFRFWQR